MLREDHPLFKSPLAIDFSKRIEIDVPDAWEQKLDGPKVKILPMVNDRNARYSDGWCTYTYEHLQAPELEIICGGVNSKTPKASAIWRQGHLLHFGFEQSPGEMNENGRAMLVNSICYIARFRDSRPIIRRSPDARLLDRGAIDRLIKNKHRDLEPYLKWFFAEKLRESLDGKTRKELADWYRSTRSFLTADKQGKFFVDEQAKRFGIPPEDLKFIPAAIAGLKKTGAEENLSKELLRRYVPSGPGADASPRDWQAWWDENQHFLFFSDSGGFRWYVDPLAKRRGIPTRDLRGQARANPEG